MRIVAIVVIGFEVFVEWVFCSVSRGVLDCDDLLPQILFGDLASGGPSSLAIDRIDPDRFPRIVSGFVAVGLVEDAESTGLSLLSMSPILGERLEGLKSPVRGGDIAERVLLAHGANGFVWLSTRTENHDIPS